MPSYTPVYAPGAAYSSTASAAITGGQLVEVTGSGTVGPAGAQSLKVVGVAAFDAASGARVTVHRVAPIHEATASGAVTAGDQLVSAAGGQVATLPAASAALAGDINAARSVIGVALTSAASGAKVQFIHQR